MEEDIRKQGILYLQQQRFGKKWKKVWCILYRESSCSISRLEFYECKDGGGHVEKNDRILRKQQESKKVIRLADCIRVTEIDIEGCPKDTESFLIETTDKIYVFASDRQHLADWTHKLCQIAFPVSWAEPGVKRGGSQRGNRVDEDEGMEDNFLYSGSRDTVRDFRVCVRRTEASDRCRLKGDNILQAGVDALHLLDLTGDVLFSWPYRYLRRFGRDKSTFSFEAGRRCESGEGSFEFDTKQGNVLFQAVECAINLQRISVPNRQTSEGGQMSPDTVQNLSLPPLPTPLLSVQSRTPPPLQLRSHVPQPPAAQANDTVYSTVSDTHGSSAPSPHHHHHHRQQQHPHPPLSHLDVPLDKTLTGVKSLTLDPRGAPHKTQVKMISSCPLPHAGSAPSEQTYSQVLLPAKRSIKKDWRGVSANLLQQPDPEYSLPFDTIAQNVMTDILSSRQAAGADPLYDSIEEMAIRNITTLTPSCCEVEHIYDEPEGFAAAAAAPARSPTSGDLTPSHSVYDNPEEMKGDAWRIMARTADPKGHEYPYNPVLDDYAVPKRVTQLAQVAQRTSEEEEEDGEWEEPLEEEEQKDSPYNNVAVKMA